MLNSKLVGSVRVSKLSLPSHYINNTTAFQDVTQTRLNCVLFGDSYSSYPGTRLALRLAYTPGFPIRILARSQAVPAAFRSTLLSYVANLSVSGQDRIPSESREEARTLTAHSVSPRPLKLGAHQFPLTARCIASSNPKISTQWDLSRPSGSMKLASTINGRPLILSHKPFEAHVSTPSLYSNPKAGHGD